MKNLLFAALLVIIAVANAYAQSYQATPESSNPNAPKFDCTNLTMPTCGSLIPNIYIANSDTPVLNTSGSAYDLHYQD